MFRSLRTRLWLSYFAVVSLALCVIAAGLLIYFLRNPLADRDATQRMRAILTSLPQIPEDFTNRLIAIRFAERLDERFDVRVLLLDEQGTTLFDSRTATHPELFFTRVNVRQSNGIVRDADGNQWLYVTRRVLTSNQLIVLAAPRQPRLQILAQLANVLAEELFASFLQAFLLALILALLLAYALSRWVSAPLQRMAHAAQQIAQGRYPTIQLEGPPEVQSLGLALNQMTHALRNTQQSQRDLVANVSHELKTPLTSIQGFAQALVDGAADTPEAQRAAAHIIYNEAERMRRLVYDLLDLARLEAGTLELRPETITLPEMLQHLLNKLAPQIQTRGLQVQLQFEALPALQADPDRLLQVFTNLLENAIRYSPQGGTITLAAQRVGNYIEVRISDQGPGIPPEEQARIFERFYRADKSRAPSERQSVGLGLAIAREIVRAHGGDLWVQSVLGQGSTFGVQLPINFAKG